MGEEEEDNHNKDKHDEEMQSEDFDNFTPARQSTQMTIDEANFASQLDAIPSLDDFEGFGDYGKGEGQMRKEEVTRGIRRFKDYYI